MIFLRPSGPSFASFSSVGIATVSSWRMMLALMYGVMPIAMMVMFWKEPPVIMLMM